MVQNAIMRKKFDNRMQLILIVEECKRSKNKKAYFTEYEICSEGRIPGVLDYGSGALLCSLLQEKNQKGLYTYAVRVKHIEKEYKFDESSYSKEGYYFENGLIGELMALFSVYFQARFYLKATVTGELTSKSLRLRSENEFQYKIPNPFLNFEMFSDQKRNWAYPDGLNAFLDTIGKLDQKYHQNLIRAFYWYAEAIKEIGIDHQLFFIKMVSAVESLLKFVEISPDSLNEKLRALIKNNSFTNDESSAIERWFENRMIRQRFASFLLQHSNNFFKGGKRKARHCHIYKNQLDKYAKHIYDARSAYLHNGNPMYLSQDMRGEYAKDWDLDPSLGMMSDRKKFAASEKLPRTRWFERLVNLCFKNFIKHLTSNKIKE